MIFDHAETEHTRRHVQLRLLPGSSLPQFKAAGATDIFIIGGDLTIWQETRGEGDFFVIEAGALVDVSTQYGTRGKADPPTHIGHP